MTRLKSFAETQQRLGPFTLLPERPVSIDVRQVVGSVSQPKVATLTHDFLPRRARANRTRYLSICDAMKAGSSLPLIEVYALRGEYYVVDGHNRVAAARRLGVWYVDALVHECLLPATSAANRLYNERLQFTRVTGLESVVLTEVGQYRKLMNQLQEHQFFLRSRGRGVDLKTVAADWYEYVYTPIAMRLAASGALHRFPGRTVSDLYVYVCDYKWIHSQQRGLDIGFPKALADFERLYPPTGIAGSALSAAGALRYAISSSVGNAIGSAFGGAIGAIAAAIKVGRHSLPPG